MKRNYQKEMEIIEEQLSREGRLPSLLLHSCCAPCSSSVLEQLARYFRVTVLYYNPNIYPEEEYYFRKEEQKEFIRTFPLANPVEFLDADYIPSVFYETVKGMERVPEGGERCFKCYELRLRETARRAAENEFEYFATTLTLSPLKNAEKLNEIGEKLMQEYPVKWLPSDFKKKNGYLRSTQITREYGMYRQNYCGCVYSMREETGDEQQAAKISVK